MKKYIHTYILTLVYRVLYLFNVDLCTLFPLYPHVVRGFIAALPNPIACTETPLACSVTVCAPEEKVSKA